MSEASPGEELVAWEGERCLALAKPAGLPVFPPHADPEGDCVLARLRAARPEQVEAAWPFGFRGGIAHRLDVSTSGQLLVARSIEDLEWLRELFGRRWLRKRYRFLSARWVPWTEHIVDARIAHDRRRKGRMVVERGKRTPHRGRWYEAETRFRRVAATLEEALPEGAEHVDGSLWAAEMRTGVMHQIRIHAAFAGVALAGDRRYGGGPSPWVRPEGVHFHLHHLGVEAPGLEPTPVPLPPWWPVDPGHRDPGAGEAGGPGDGGLEPPPAGGSIAP